MLKLQVEKREERGRKARLSGDKIPAVFYGPKEETTSVYLETTDFIRVWKEAGESSVIILEGIGDEKEALIQEVSLDPVLDNPVHADFYVIEKGKKVEVDVPLEFTGESPAVKNLGGILVKVMHELPIEAQPRNLPPEIEVDISGLENFEDHILVKDITLPEGVEVTIDLEETVVLIQEPREEEEEEPEPVEFDESMVEVEKKGKEDEEGGDGGEAEKSADENKG